MKTLRDVLVDRIMVAEQDLGWSHDAEWVGGLDDDEVVSYFETVCRASGAKIEAERLIERIANPRIEEAS
jgi:hypothetical protein